MDSRPILLLLKTILIVIYFLNLSAMAAKGMLNFFIIAQKSITDSLLFFVAIANAFLSEHKIKEFYRLNDSPSE